MKFIIGKKIEMTQLWQGEKLTAVTKVKAGPCPIVQIKTADKDGYEAVQLGFDKKKEKNINKPQKNHLAKFSTKGGSPPAVPGHWRAGASGGNTNIKYLREFINDNKDLHISDLVNVETFNQGDIVKVTGTSKGCGFAGSVKRHGFHGHNKTHGTKDQVRTSGAIGAGGPQHVFKGTRMPGRMGNAQVTTKNLKIIKIDKENNILYILGAVPGARNSLVLISGEGELKVQAPEAPKGDKQMPEMVKAAEEVLKTPAEDVKTVPFEAEEKNKTAVNSKQTAENTEKSAEIKQVANLNRENKEKKE